MEMCCRICSTVFQLVMKFFGLTGAFRNYSCCFVIPLWKLLALHSLPRRKNNEQISVSQPFQEFVIRYVQTEYSAQIPSSLCWEVYFALSSNRNIHSEIRKKVKYRE